MLEGLKRGGRLPERVVVSDPDAAALEALRPISPAIELAPGDNPRAAACDVVFLALHPPILKPALPDLREHVRPGALVVSLAPKLTLRAISDGLGGFGRVSRMIPNAPSIAGAGFNPIAFADSLAAADRKGLLELLSPLGETPEVPESKLEAYALLTAMGPTYLWFQLYELKRLAETFGLSPEEAGKGLAAMVGGALKAMDVARPEDVMDLVPVKPLGPQETAILKMYRDALVPLFEKLKT
jgi:pyrroline-5-carboxylate reductase